MASDKLDNSADIELLLRTNGDKLTSLQLRSFACACCRRISQVCDDPIYLQVLEAAEERAKGSVVRDRLAELDSDYDRLYRALYPGYGAPSAAALALVAVGEAAYRESALDAAISSATTAAEAMAKAKAADVDDTRYDDVHEAAFRSECLAQLELLKGLNFPQEQ